MSFKELPDNISNALSFEFNKLNLKFYNEEKIHHKIQLSIDNKKYTSLRLIPKGLKGFLWFKKYKNKQYSYFLQYNKNKKKMKCYQFNCCFDSYLTNKKGTILYGNLLKIDESNIPFFVCDNIYYYQGNKILNCNNNNLIDHVINNEIKRIIYTKNDICIMNSIIINLNKDSKKYNYKLLENTIQKLKYKIYSIKFYNININKIDIYYYDENKKNININNTKEKQLYIKPMIEEDSYIVYDENDNNLGYADISNYKTSILLNNIFRNIKENENLDLLEESDDEEEFENIREDKFVDLDKKILFNCIYNNKFKLWKPISKV